MINTLGLWINPICAAKKQIAWRKNDGEAGCSTGRFFTCSLQLILDLIREHRFVKQPVHDLCLPPIGRRFYGVEQFFG